MKNKLQTSECQILSFHSSNQTEKQTKDRTIPPSVAAIFIFPLTLDSTQKNSPVHTHCPPVLDPFSRSQPVEEMFYTSTR